MWMMIANPPSSAVAIKAAAEIRNMKWTSSTSISASTIRDTGHQSASPIQTVLLNVGHGTSPQCAGSSSVKNATDQTHSPQTRRANYGR